MLIHPLIKTDYIKPREYYKTVKGNPFDFPMNLDDSGIMAKEEMVLICGFLNNYPTKTTQSNYTKELEKFCQWLWRVKRVGLIGLSIQDAKEFIEFTKSPPYHWISRRISAPKFLESGEACRDWRPFTSRAGGVYSPSRQAVRITISVMRTFYNHLMDEDLETRNPFHRIRPV